MTKPVAASTILIGGVLDTGWHQHAEHQLIYAEGGVLYVLTAESQFLLPARHGAWIPACCAHKLESPSPQTKLWLLYFPPEDADDAALQNVRIFGVSALAREMVLYTERWSNTGQPPDKISALAAHFYETIRLLVAEWCSQPLSLVLPYVTSGTLGAITRDIRENLGEPLDIDTLAQHHGVSGRTLMRLFRSQLGMTFGTYLRIARVVKAVELLTSPDASVLAVAYAVGYNSPSSFSQAFRQVTGLTPLQYAATATPNSQFQS